MSIEGEQHRADDHEVPDLGPLHPIHERGEIEELLDAAKRLSPRHWALVVILYKTGMELEAVAKLTWRDVYPDKLVWKPSKSRDEREFSLDDPDLVHALNLFVTGQRKSADQMDYWIRQIREDTRNPELRRVTAITLRLTRALHLLERGLSPATVSEELRLPLSAVLRVSTQARPPH